MNIVTWITCSQSNFSCEIEAFTTDSTSFIKLYIGMENNCSKCISKFYLVSFKKNTQLLLVYNNYSK